jgi:tripartite ATP-independent transporter DctM subunit
MGLFTVGMTGVLYLVGFDQALAATAPTLYNYVAKYSFSVIPMFVLMGQLGAHSGLFSEVFEVARKWTGRLSAGLAVSTVGAQTIFAAASGSGPAACVVIGKVAFPAMRKMNYPDELSTGVIAGSGTLAALIPPSVAICVYGVIVDESVGKLLIGGILPGLLTAGIYVTLLMIQARHVPRDTVKYSWREKFYAIRYLWVVGVLIIAIMGGIYAGICTPTEGGAFGAFVVFIMALLSGNLSKHVLWQSIRSTVITTGMLFFLLVSVMAFSRFLTLSGFSHSLTGWVASTDLPRIFIFLMVSAVYLALGCFVGGVGMQVMTLPLFYPMMMNLGYDSVWFGIVTVMFIELAMETPPVGVNLFATKSIAEGVSITTIMRGVVPFIVRDLIAITLIYIFPQIVTFLPSLM